MSLFAESTDAWGRAIRLPARPRRIVSLVPSQTELLADLGLNDEVVGLTRFCVHPEDWKGKKTIVGGTKQINMDRVHALKPDLILANREENTREMVEALDDVAPVYVTDVASLPDALLMIRTVGLLTGHAEQAEALARTVDDGFQALGTYPPLRTAYLIWQQPYMTVGADTFIHAMMGRVGLENVFADRTRYPEVTLAAIQDARPDVLLLSSEPYPFTEHHANDLRPALPDTVIRRVDGERFSWYGSRLTGTPAYLRALRDDLKTAHGARR